MENRTNEFKAIYIHKTHRSRVYTQHIVTPELKRSHYRPPLYDRIKTDLIRDYTRVLISQTNFYQKCFVLGSLYICKKRYTTLII
jgi:hypothetical protein